MKKIANWTIGSFFRTIGRIIAYTLIGCLLGYLLNKLPIKKLLPDLFSLSVVKADTLSYTDARFGVNQCKLNCNVSGDNCIFTDCQWDSNHTMGNYVNFGSTNGHLRKIEFIVSDSGDYQPGQYIFEWSFSVNPRFTDINDYIIALYTSRNSGNDRFNASSCYIYPVSNYMYNVSCSFTTDQLFDTLKVVFEWPCGGDNQNTCTFSNDNIPNNSNWIYWDRIDTFSISNDSTSAINNQTTIIQNEFNEVNENISDLKDSITDESAPDITGLDNDSIAGWLPPGPVDSILNLPLTLLNALNRSLSGVCATITIPLPYIDKELPIPCLSSLYTDMGVGSFFSWVGNIAAAFILFKYLISLYKYVDDTLTFRENHYIDNWGGVD